ncbi:transposase [Streptomyces sp. NPDC039022]|uniref:transposase n=1 Tax=Streptomyces sp. NPDC039022 TaxID=3157091 RepID=UPI0033CA2E1C
MRDLPSGGGFAAARSLRAYAGTAPLSWSSGTSHTVVHRKVCNRCLKRTTRQWAFAALTRSPGCRALYETRRNRVDGYAAALRHVGNKLCNDLYRCLTTGDLYREEIMFPNP